MKFRVVFTVSVDGCALRVKTEAYSPATADRLAVILRQEGAKGVCLEDTTTGVRIYAG